MDPKEMPVLSAFWADTRELLSRKESRDILQNATLESLTPAEVLLRDQTSGRLIVIAGVNEKNLTCSLCREEDQRAKGVVCPFFATCFRHRARP